MSFGSEAEEDEFETTEFVQKNAGKAKSLHDAVNDPKLSKEPIKVKNERIDEDESERVDYQVTIEEMLDGDDDAVKRRQRIKDKLKLKSSKHHIAQEKTVEIKIENSDSDDLLLTHEEEKKQQSERKK